MNLLLELNYRQRNATRLLTGVFGVVAFWLVQEHTKTCMALGALLALMFRNPTMVFAVVTTFKRDAMIIYRFVSLNISIAIMEWRGWNLPRILQEQMKKRPNKAAFVMEDRVLSFQDVEDYSSKVGAYFKEQGLSRGDCVALLMETRPEYPCLWLGLSKIGVITALVNSNQRRGTLLHSIKVAEVKAIVVGTEMTAVLQEVLHDEQVCKIPVYQFSDRAQREAESFKVMAAAIDLTLELERQHPENLSADVAAGMPRDKLMYVYTSGTTGLPKAAVITHVRYVFMCSGVYNLTALRSSDVVYTSLPLYHTAGGIVGVGQAIIHGSTVVLRKKFSASNFWKDCIKYNCTAAQYIGELCRYLLSAPPKPEDTQHRLRIMYGNGLRPQIWSQFVSRFNIPSIGEIYGSTEGNSNMINFSNQVGAVGFVPLVIRKWYTAQIIRCDEETGEPLRDSSGLCMRCEPGEAGLLVGRVDHRRAVTAFNGYADKEASEKKLLRNVFRKGDVFFNSGDMIVSDILGFCYFKDRTGDTFRWRGENVATQEVEAIITNVIGLQDCVVYGVNIPHVEGKAGMAAIEDPDRKLDLAHLSAGIRGSLPSYAQPLFIRLMDAIPRTDTFKMKKRDLVAEAFDMRKVKDPLFYLSKDGFYRPLTEQHYEDIMQGKAGL